MLKSNEKWPGKKRIRLTLDEAGLTKKQNKKEQVKWFCLLACLLILIGSPFIVPAWINAHWDDDEWWRDERSVQYDAAVEAVQQKPMSAEAHYKLGEALRMEEDYPGAAREWRRVMELNPSGKEAYVAMARHYLREAPRPSNRKAEK